MTEQPVRTEATVPALRATGVSKTFAGVVALDDLHLVIEHGEVHALLGENGSGKSTFIKILSGYHAPDPGGEGRVGENEGHLGATESADALGCRVGRAGPGL